VEHIRSRRAQPPVSFRLVSWFSAKEMSLRILSADAYSGRFFPVQTG
jgi:hypothetical protein